MKNEFYQSKYEYYKKILLALCVFASLGETLYFFADCQIFNGFSYNTFIPRFSILIPLAIYLVIINKINDFRITIAASYVLLHLVMWCSIFSATNFPDQILIKESFIVMHLMFMVAGFAAPKRMSAISHFLVITNILVSSLFNHYENFFQMILLNIFCYIGIQTTLYVLEKTYKEHYDLLKKLEHSSKIDQLTGVYNRHKLEDLIIENTNELINKDDKDIAIAIMDIDLFKNINDTYGHNKGDKVIVSSVDITQKNIFNRDYIIRWGGEEFLIIFYNCDLKMAEKKCEIIRKLIEDSDNGVCKSTVSIGLAKYDNEDYKKSIGNADKALYEAKETGRNKVVVYKE